MKTLQELKQEVTNCINTGITNGYPTELKHEIVEAHYNLNMPLSKLSVELSISIASINSWRLKYGKQGTGIVQRNRVLLDVRSKCLIVRKHLVDGISAAELGRTHAISDTSIKNWVRAYGDTYEEYIGTLPEGVPYIVKEDKLIRGDKNILEARAKLQENIDLLTKISVNIDMGRIEKKTISDLIKKESTKKKELDNAMAILHKHGVSI